MLNLAPTQGPNGIQLFTDGANLFMVPSEDGAQYDCYVFDLANQGSKAPNLKFGALDSGWTQAITLATASAAVLSSEWAVFAIAQETPKAGKPCPIVIQGQSRLNVTVNSAVARGTSLAVDATGDDVRDGGGGRVVALSPSALAASGVHTVYFDGITYRG